MATATSTRPLRLDLIVRTSKRKKEARSPQQQRDMAESCAQIGGHEIVMVHDSGRSESGKTMDRATVHAAMERVRAGETDGVIVALTDRLGRAPVEEAMAVVRELDSIGYLVLADAGAKPIDLSEPMSETNLVMQLQFARQYWLTTANRFKRSQRDAIEAGKFVGPTPIGYERHEGRLYPHPELGPVITEAYRRAASQGLKAAIEYLQEHVPWRKWNTATTRQLLRSRTYLGESRTGKLINEHAHEPLATLADWTAAQTVPTERRRRKIYPLSGIARCSTCGGSMVGQFQQVWNGEAHRRYRCRQSCPRGASIGAEKLECFVKDSLREILGDDDLSAVFKPAGVDQAREDMRQAKAELTAYLTNPALSALGDDFQAGAEVRRQALEQTEAEYRKLVGQAATSELLPPEDELDDPEQFAQALRVIVSRIFVKPGRAPAAVRVRMLALYNGDEVAWPLTPESLG